jgi:hypothetical protein
MRKQNDKMFMDDEMSNGDIMNSLASRTPSKLEDAITTAARGWIVTLS